MTENSKCISIFFSGLFWPSNFKEFIKLGHHLCFLSKGPWWSHSEVPQVPATWCKHRWIVVRLGSPVMNKATDNRHLYNANHGWKNAIFSIQDLWYRALHTSRWPSLIILQVIIGRRGCSSWRRIRSSGWGPESAKKELGSRQLI